MCVFCQNIAAFVGGWLVTFLWLRLDFHIVISRGRKIASVIVEPSEARVDVRIAGEGLALQERTVADQAKPNGGG